MPSPLPLAVENSPRCAQGHISQSPVRPDAVGHASDDPGRLPLNQLLTLLDVADRLAARACGLAITELAQLMEMHHGELSQR